MQRIALALAFGGAVWMWAGAAAADPGELTGIEIGTLGNNFGYWEYLPTAYDEEEEWPLFIFLSGIGENGDGMLDPTNCANGGATNTPGEATLCRNLRHGPQLVLWEQLHNGGPELWDDVERPFIVISPQNPAPLFFSTPYNADDLDEFLDFLIGQYSVDTRRMYLTGMSIGGYSTVLSIVAYPDRYAAVSMMPGIAGGDEQDAVCNLTEQNMWVIHGENDGGSFFPSPMVSFGYLFSQCPEPVPTPRITVFTGAGHNVWTRTIDPTIGMGDPTLDTFFSQGVDVDLDPMDIELYDWLLLHDKPVVYAGPDIEITTDDTPYSIAATTTDDDAITYTWTQTAGVGVTLANENTDTLDISGFDIGEYTFEVLAVDADDQHDTDEIVVTVVEAPPGTTTGGPGGTTMGLGDTGVGTQGTGAMTSGTSGGDTEPGGASTGPGGGTTGGEGGTASDPTDPSGTQGSTSGNETGTASATASASATAGMTTNPSGSTDSATSGDTDSDSETGTSDDTSGCGCTSTQERGPIGLGVLLLLAAGRRRRRLVN